MTTDHRGCEQKEQRPIRLACGLGVLCGTLLGCHGGRPDGSIELTDGPTVSAPLPLGSPDAVDGGIHRTACITRDGSGIPHIRASDEHDLFFLQGWVHAEDRLFQMDVTRRRGSGRLAEILGEAALPGDVQLRSLGLRRAAELSLPLLQDRTRHGLEAYAEGVNAYVSTHPLPPEYAALALSKFEPWTVLDSVTAAKALTLTFSFNLGDIDRTLAFQSYVTALGPTAGSALFYQDLFRAAPFDPASTIPDAQQSDPDQPSPYALTVTSLRHPGALELAAEYREKLRGDPFLERFVSPGAPNRGGSNQWVVSGALTANGRPLLANDQHISLVAPPAFYMIHLESDSIDVIGNSFAGAPFVVVGHNRHLAWGATVNPFDVTDVFEEEVLVDSTSPSGLATVYLGQHEAVLPIPESYSVNRLDGVLDNVVPVPPSAKVPAETLVVPRRNNGPLVQLDVSQGVGLSVQYTGFSGTRELDAFFGFDTADTLEDFTNALRRLDAASQNFFVADDDGNIAYFTNSAVPIREDLQQEVVAGAPPWFIRNGTGGNEWLPVLHPEPEQVVPFEVLGFDEMPHVLNPKAGFLVNANNDPDGLVTGNDPLARRRVDGGFYYLSRGYDEGFRAARITSLIRDVVAQGKMTFSKMQSIQADTTPLDAQVFVPVILEAFSRARQSDAPPPLAALGADAKVAEAVCRLSKWDLSMPTGILEGYDASDVRGHLSPPSHAEIDASVAATLYSVFRGQLIRNVLDAHLSPLPSPQGELAVTALRNLFDRFPEQHGVGTSGIDFFAVPGVTATAEDRRDVVVLQSLSGALALLAGPNFDPAFHSSTDQQDYRWGKLHRVVFEHPMGRAFNIPPALGLFNAPLAGLPGIPKGGGFEVVDDGSHDPRADSVNAFMFTVGPASRTVMEISPEARFRMESVLPGGESGVPGSPLYLNLLPLWLTNDTVALPFTDDELSSGKLSVERFGP